MPGQCGIRMYEEEKNQIISALSQNLDAAKAYKRLSSEPKEVTSENAELLVGLGLATIVKGQYLVLSRKGMR